MHKKGSPETMQLDPSYKDVVGEIKAYLTHMCDLACSAGVSRDKLVVDPGIGFGKLLTHNIAILNALNEFSEIGYAVMIGTSRKRSLQEICEPNLLLRWREQPVGLLPWEYSQGQKFFGYMM